MCPWASHSTVHPGLSPVNWGAAIEGHIQISDNIIIVNSKGTDLVDNPGTVEVPVFGWLPPAEPSRSRTGFQGYLQGDVPAHVAGVAEKELLKETPREAAVVRILQKHRLAPGIRNPFTTSQSHEELHKSDMSETYCRYLLQ